MSFRRGMLAALLAVLPAVAAVGVPVHAQQVLKPAIVYSTGGKADKSFNESASNGVKRFTRATNRAVSEFEPTNDRDFEPALQRFAQSSFDPIVAVGFLQAAALAKVAKAYPDSRFGIIDASVDQPNVRSFLFKEQESTFLVGMAAALASKTGRIGFVGGMDGPLMRRFQCGFEQGIKYANPKAELIANMAGATSAAWNDPILGAKIAKAQFERGVDVIYAAAGTTGVGVIQAAKDNKKLAIGSANKGSDPDTILTSTSKRVDVAVFQAFTTVLQGKWKAGPTLLGLKEGAVDWSPEDYNRKLITPEMKKKIDAARADIVADKIVVHDYTSNNSCKR